jgi:hypothetical protein
VEQAEALAKRLKPTGERLPEGETEGGKKTTTPVSVPTSGGARKDYASIKFDANAPSAKDMITKGLEKK